MSATEDHGTVWRVRFAKVIPCKCGYWVDEDMENDPSKATPMAIYDAATGLLDCVECGAPMLMDGTCGAEVQA